MAHYRIEIKNETDWDTRHLRAFAVRAAAMVFAEKEKRGKTLHVHFKSARLSDLRRAIESFHGCSGVANLYGTWCEIRIPVENINKVDLAHVLAHEFGHNKGLTHQDMAGSPIYGGRGVVRGGESQQRLFAWANTLPLAKKTKPVKTPIAPADLASKKLAQVQARIKGWERRAKRAATALKKYRKQEKYYAARSIALVGKPAAVRRPPQPQRTVTINDNGTVSARISMDLWDNIAERLSVESPIVSRHGMPTLQAEYESFCRAWTKRESVGLYVYRVTLDLDTLNFINYLRSVEFKRMHADEHFEKRFQQWAKHFTKLNWRELAERAKTTEQTQ